ncbi:hypothetical protein PNEG_03274 [Pneumocystis murina B123]|uniref:U3 small nucleolar RNA-associated protein 22 n=1 Tax=Pneumocystis murina (strain B123) TaxID=1069680 RepID=M7NIM6_PNEMU|nr:hypothetical protein PNEG_03274 [Pneumocystis murina B123]EMR08443.1 hypothetical protein PNEG_03274 [Pneumocystis murina B123]
MSSEFEDEESDDTFQGFDTDTSENHVSGHEKDFIKNKKDKKFLSQKEIEEFQRNESLFKSNYFKLQIDDLLDETRLNSNDIKEIQNYIYQIKNIIENIPNKKENDINFIIEEMKEFNICIPFPEPKPSKDVKYTFSYSKPTSITIIGSFSLGTSIKEDSLNIDLAVEIPEKIFQKKDYMNYRYFYKRSYYLACLAEGIKKSPEFRGKLSFQLFNRDQLKPIIVISYIKDNETHNHKKWNIFIIPSISQNVFQSSKLSPNKSCIASVDCPTPNYNFSILSDCTINQHHTVQYTCLQSCPAFRDTSILGKIWLKKRGFNSKKNGFGSFEWNIIMAYHLQHKKNQFSQYSSYHLFKITLQFLATQNLLENPIYMNSGKFINDLSKKKPGFFTFNDINILQKLSYFDFQLIQLYASITLKLLNDSSQDNFKSIFLERVDIIPLQFDCYYKVFIPQNWEELSKDYLHEVSLKETSFILKLIDIIKKAVGNRILQITSIVHSNDIIWNIDTEFPSNIISNEIYIGILIDQENSQKIVERGPSPQDINATKEFQQFWGKKSELRRFKDGNILESVVWNVENKLWLIKDIIKFAVNRYVGSNISETYHFFGPEYDKYINFPKTYWPIEFSQIRIAFDSLAKEIKSIENFPLQISSIIPSNEFLRYTAINLPFFSESNDFKKYYSEPCDIIIRFESSGNWPDDLKAIQRTKLAFLIKLSEKLYFQNNDIISRVGLENTDSECLNLGFLDIKYKNLIFRLRIHHDREKTLLQKDLKNGEVSQYQRSILKRGIKLYDETYISKPNHTLIFQDLCHKFKALSLSIRLTKKWFHSHLLSFHVPEVLIELVVAKIFINSAPWPPPATANTGFLRCLSMLASWDWRSSPLIIDFSENMSSETYKIIQNQFSTFRKQDPGINSGAMYITCNYENNYYSWIWNKPSRSVSGRITLLAKNSLHILKQMDEKNIRKAFLPSLKDFDFLIYLNKASEIIENSKIFQEIIFPEPDIIDMFVRQLEDIYGDSFIFFYNKLQKSVIAGVINPHILSARSWKVNLGFSSMPLQNATTNDENMVHGNILSMLGEIERLGNNLVKKIDIQNLHYINNIQ